MGRCRRHGGLVERRNPFMDSEEIQQGHLLPSGGGRPETVKSGAAVVSSPEVDPASPLNVDLALALLERRDLPPETLEQLGRDPAALKSRKVCVALAGHPRAPRHLAAEQLVTRLPSVPLGERLMLARRASETVAAALLLDKQPRVAHTALENSRLTEAAVIRALLRLKA